MFDVRMLSITRYKLDKQKFKQLHEHEKSLELLIER